MRRLHIWMKSDRGASMIEYGLLVVLIAVVAIIAIGFAGTQVSAQFAEIGSELSTPSSLP